MVRKQASFFFSQESVAREQVSRSCGMSGSSSDAILDAVAESEDEILDEGLPRLSQRLRAIATIGPVVLIALCVLDRFLETDMWSKEYENEEMDHSDENTVVAYIKARWRVVRASERTERCKHLEASNNRSVDRRRRAKPRHRS